jgi:hypothetical protein
MWKVKSVVPWVHKAAMRSLFLAGATTLLATMAAPAANAQVVISVTPPVCVYGYYEYSPYGCAPSGFYGPGYFYNGIFLGVGPWANWGYGHGWGGHRFSGAGGGRYVAGRGNGGRAYAANRGHESAARAGGARVTTTHAAAHSAPHAAAAHSSGSHAPPHGTSHASHPAASHGGEASHGGGERK